MAVRVADSLKQQNDLKTFPVAYSEDIWLDENKGEGDANFKDLQTLFNENKLGGSGLPEPESADKVLLSASSNTRADGLEWKQVSKNDVGMQLPEFESLDKWDSLPADEKSKYYNAGKGYVVIKEDVKGAKGVIDDTKPTSTVTTLSAKKINDSLVDLESNEIRRITKAESLQSGFSIDSHEGSWIVEYVSTDDMKGHGTFPSGLIWCQIEQYKSLDFVRQICTHYDASGLRKTLIRGAWCNDKLIENAVWSAWQELTTMDKVARFPDYSRRITMTASTWVATEDVYITFLRMDSNQLPSADSIKINNIGVGSTDFDGSGSNVGVVTFSGYVRKGSTIESSALQNPSSCKIYPLI